MKNIRKGNDIKIAWSIYMEDGTAFNLDGLNVSLYLTSMFSRKKLDGFVVNGNIIQWTFYGKDQKSSGNYSLELVVNEDKKGMITTDACDFVNLVSCSCQLNGGKDEDGVETQTIELESKVDVASGEVVTIVVDADLSETSVNPVQNKVITAELNKKAYKTEIPTKMSQLEQDIEIGGDVDLSEYPTKKEVSDNYQPKGDYVEVERWTSTNMTMMDSINLNATELSQQQKSLTELSAEVGKKQDTITDLATIRSGAAKGATALQSVPDTYATKTDVSNAIQSAITNELNADF